MKIKKIRYSIEPKDRIYVKGHGFLSFAKRHEENFKQKIWSKTS